MGVSQLSGYWSGEPMNDNKFWWSIWGSSTCENYNMGIVTRG